jgi:phosphohistidine phosphatase
MRKRSLDRSEAATDSIAMKVYFLRHGIAFDRDEWKGSDFDRPLTDEGRERMEREAKTIARLNVELDVIITSPLLRARKTAEIVADRLHMNEQLVQDERLGPDLDSDTLRAILRERAMADAVMLVGHDPSMTELVGELSGGAAVDLKKGGLACIDLADASCQRGQLLWLLPPKLLAL